VSGRRFDVCSVVVSHLPHDARVWKEARTLADSGRTVRLIGLRYGLDRPTTTGEGRIEVLEQPFGERGRGGAARRALIMLRLWLAVLRTPARVYHCHNIHPAPAVLLAARLRRAKVIYDAHELYGQPERGAGHLARLVARAARFAERAIARSAACVITTNPARARVLAERHGLDAVAVIGNLPRRVDEVVPLDPGFPPGRTLLYQGGIYAEARAFRTAIGALRHLPGVSFVIVGFGRERDIGLIREWAREAGVDERVHLYDPVPFDDLVGIAAAASVGIVPLRNISLNSYLGDTNKLFEYLMAGLPVVGSDFPEVARVLHEGEPAVGEAFDPEDERSIATAIEAVLERDYPERRQEARRLALERWCWGHEEPKLVEIYEGL
jgi:glycosyltransferase involved in cell wall biosynthesis